jgi:phosphohistidine phosphatase
VRTLLLLRHAKSDWSTALDDHERPLNERGRRARHVIADHLAAQVAGGGVGVDRIVSSDAVRALATAEPLAAALGLELVVEPAIYDASVGGLLAVVRSQPDGAGSVVLVGHNPGVEELSATLAGRPVGYPTAALGTLALDVERWAAVGPGCGRLVAHVSAKGLSATGGAEG